MKIDFSTPIRNLEGIGIKTKDGEKETDFTIREVSVNALLNETQESAKLDGKEKVKRFRLADKIWGCKEPITLQAEDIVLLKENIAKVYGTLITARAWEIMDGEDVLEKA
jgi:hypothetical protein